MRLVLAALCAVLLMCLVGCGSGQAEQPSTLVEAMNIQVALPGSDWHKVSSDKKDVLQTERWENGDNTLFYRVASDPDEAMSYPQIDTDLVEKYVNLFDFPPSTLVTTGMLNGRTAVRLEGVSSDGAYRTLDYVFVGGLRHFYLGAGATSDVWAAGGDDIVYDIFESVKIVPSK